MIFRVYSFTTRITPILPDSTQPIFRSLPSLYAEWVRITRGEVEQPSSIIRSRFGARFVHTDLNHVDFIEQAEKDPNLSEVYRDDQSVLFEVIDP